MTNKGLAIATILDSLCDTTLHLDAENESEGIRYTEEDVMNALQVFMHVTGNYAIHKLMDEHGQDMNKVEHMQMNAAKLADWLLDMTGINSRTFYSKS